MKIYVLLMSTLLSANLALASDVHKIKACNRDINVGRDVSLQIALAEFDEKAAAKCAREGFNDFEVLGKTIFHWQVCVRGYIRCI